MPLSLVRVAGWLLVAGIILLSVLPGPDRPHSGAPGHFEHVVAYLLASIVLALGYPSHPARIALLSLLVALSGALELLQLTIPGRTGEWAGFVGSSAGTLIGLLAISLLSGRQRTRATLS